jgi:hypothetical protein
MSAIILKNGKNYVDELLSNRSFELLQVFFMLGIFQELKTTYFKFFRFVFNRYFIPWGGI